MPLRHLVLFIAFLALLTSACQISLAGDILPPAGSELGQAAAPSEPLAFPAAMPDVRAGGLIYARSCAPCHGARGLGDGEQAGALPVAVPAISDPELARASSLEEWYMLISRGDLDKYMPPFAGSLSVQERWDVLAYAYSLSQDEDQLQAGEQIGAALGQSQGDLEALSVFSQDELGALLADDLDLSTQDGGALAAYLLASALGLSPTSGLAELDIEQGLQAAEDAAPDVEGEELTQTAGGSGASETIILQGAVSNGSGGELPANAEVLLRGFDHSREAFSASTGLDENGRYRFEQTDLDPTLVYAITIEYEGLIYFSEAIQLDGTQTEFELPLIVYEITHDASSLVIEHLQLVLQFAGEGRIRVVQLVVASNTGLQAVAPQADAEPALRYSLPPEASNLAFESGAIGERYVPTEDGFGDLRAVLPGSGAYQMLYAYELPYGRGLEFSQGLTLPISSVTVFAPAGQIELQSEDFVVLGSQELDGETFTGYQSRQAYAAGETVNFELRGAHPLGSANWLVDLVNQREFLVGLIGLALAVAFAWLWLRRVNAQQPSPEEVMDAIIALDARYAEARMSEDNYLKRRAALKARLRRALEAQAGKRP